MAAERVDYYSDEEFEQAVHDEREEAAFWEAYDEERQRMDEMCAEHTPNVAT